MKKIQACVAIVAGALGALMSGCYNSPMTVPMTIGYRSTITTVANSSSNAVDQTMDMEGGGSSAADLPVVK